MAKKTMLQVAAEAQKKWGLEVDVATDEMLKVDFVSTGHFAMDYALGGGIPIGRISEYYGPPSSGKTTLSLQAGAAVQRTGRMVLFMDYEHTFDRSYAEALGMDTQDSSLYMMARPDNLEQGANFSRAAIETGEVGLVIYDSVAAMTPIAITEQDTGSKGNFGSRAKLMSELITQLVPILKKNNCHVIFLNHIMEMIGASMPGRPPLMSTPGGRALKFFATHRVEFKPSQGSKEKTRDALLNTDAELVTSQTIIARVVKNKVAPPFRTVPLQVRFGKGFSEEWTAMQVLTAFGIVQKDSSGNYRIPAHFGNETLRKSGPKHFGDYYITGEPNMVAFLEQNHTIARLWIDEATKHVNKIPDAEAKTEDELEQQDMPDTADIDALLAAADAPVANPIDAEPAPPTPSGTITDLSAILGGS